MPPPPPPSSNYFPSSPTYHSHSHSTPPPPRDVVRRNTGPGSESDRHKERDIRVREAAAAEYKRRRNPDYVSFFFVLLSFLFTEDYCTNDFSNGEKHRRHTPAALESTRTRAGLLLTTLLTPLLREAALLPHPHQPTTDTLPDLRLALRPHMEAAVLRGHDRRDPCCDLGPDLGTSHVRILESQKESLRQLVRQSHRLQVQSDQVGLLRRVM